MELFVACEDFVVDFGLRFKGTQLLLGLEQFEVSLGARLDETTLIADLDPLVSHLFDAVL